MNTVPKPDHISFPWDESNSKFTSPSNRNYNRDCISTSETMSEMTVVPRETRQEKKLRNPSILQIGNSSNGNSQGEKVYQCETGRKSLPCNPDCAGDSGGSRRVELPYSSLEYQRYNEIPGSRSAILHDYISTGKSSALFEPFNRNLSFDEQIPETITESPVTARIPSPSSASSITSGRRLEWDSGADVGYNFIQDSNNQSGASLSTIERIALARGCSAALFERLDPEGVSGPPKPVLGALISCGELESPIGKSTPIHKIENKISSRNAGKDNEIPVVESPDTVLPGGYLYLHSGEECENEVAPSPENGSGEQNDESSDVRISTSDCFNKKHSNSLINLSSSHEEIQNSVPRSQSYLNLLDKDNGLLTVERDLCVVQQPCTLAATCSVSSSSVATIVQKPMFPKTSDKFIQTLPLKLSVGVQTCESTDHSNSSQKITDMPHDAFSPVTVVCDETKSLRGITVCNSNGFQSHKCSGAHKKGSVVNNYCQNYQLHDSDPVLNNNHSEKSTEKIDTRGKENSQAEEFCTLEKCPGTLDSVASSSQTAESSCAVDTSCSAVEMPKGGHRGSTGVVDSANSFEYLPGPVFEKAFKYQSGAPKQSAAPETSENKICSKSNFSTQNNRSDSRSSSLSKDIEEGVELLQKLMSEKSYNGKMKKKLIRQIINKLVNTNYPEDNITNEQFERIPLSSNVPWVPATPDAPHLKTVNAYHYLSVGERSNESRKSVQNSSVQSSDRGKNRSIESATSEIQSSPSCTPSGSLSVPGDNEQSQAETSISSNIVSENSRRNWKLPTSKAEKHFETNRVRLVKNGSPSPSLLHLCKSEHEKQLQWIRFEINHLSHLKQLLEKQEVVTKTLSNLADHEHRFHKFKPADKKHLQNNKFERSKTKGCDNWSNSTEYSLEKNNETSQSNASLKTQSSSGLSFQEPLLSDSSHSHIPKDRISQIQNQERTMRTTDNKHNLSTQTLTLDSYVLHNVGSTNSEVKRLSLQSHSSSNNGRLNVYVQTSPKSLKKRVHQNSPLYAKVEESARKSYENAVKCCCDCRRALEGITHTENAKKKDENIQTFCRCKSTNSESDHPATDVSCSLFGQSLDTTQSRTPESNSTDGIHLTEKRDIATETVVNKSIQTSQSLNNVPIIKPVWVRESSRNLSQKEDNICPCCGLLEKPFESEQRQYSLDKPKKRADVKASIAGGGGGKSNEITDASVQTTNKEPLAYLLTFEPTSEANVRTQSNNSLPEIKLLVPISQNRLENEMKRKASNMNTYKENQCPPNKSTQRESNSLNQLLQGEEYRTHKLTLQEYLRTNRPDYIQHADKRSQCLADLAILRDLRKQKRLELMAMTDQPENGKSKIFPSNEKIVFTCAAVPGKPKFTSRVMREQSRRKYHKTRELQNKLVEKKKKEDFRTNRLMAELFTKKLQKKVLQGVVNHSNSASVISMPL